MPPLEPRSTTPKRTVRIAFNLVALTAIVSVLGFDLSEAKEWTSPEPPLASRAAPSSRDAQPSAWPGLLWAGPQSGAPQAPAAIDCHRTPKPFEIASGHGRPPADVNALSESRGRLTDDAATALSMAPRSEKAASPIAQPLPRQRPADEPVSAGVIDDNANFDAFLAYRRRHADLPVRELDVHERYLLVVHDAAGRPVADAQVDVLDGTRSLPLWARTDAAGQAWLHPSAVASDAPVLEVRVRKAAGGAELLGRALLRRGQRDNLQVQLSGEAPPQRARLDLAFLVDATGSMGDEIDKLKRSMRAMAEQIERLPSHPDVCFALVAYRDRGDTFFVRAQDFSDDLGTVQSALNALRAEGGGDEPEAMNEALHTAVHRLAWRGDGATRMIVLVADAPPHLDYGAPYYDDDMRGAAARGIKLIAIGASGLNPVGETVFRQAAQYTGGRFVFLTYAEARDPSSGPGRETAHDVDHYSVESLDALVVRLVREELAKRPSS